LVFLLGDETCVGPLISTIRGSQIKDIKQSTINSIPFYIRHKIDLSLFHENITILSIPVYSNLATIHFRSNSSNNLHFFATYESSTECPQNYYFHTIQKQCTPLQVIIKYIIV
jgi:hypothetical protein